jgi:hypothetical protein
MEGLANAHVGYGQRMTAVTGRGGLGSAARVVFTFIAAVDSSCDMHRRKFSRLKIASFQIVLILTRENVVLWLRLP